MKTKMSFSTDTKSKELVNSFKNVKGLRNKYVHEATIPDDNVEELLLT